MAESPRPSHPLDAAAHVSRAPTTAEFIASLNLPALLTAKQAASVLGCHRLTIWRMIDDGRLKAVRLTPGHPKSPYRLPVDQVLRYLVPTS